jgi:hypothetical protein
MTELGLVIEFRRSPLHPNERIARETDKPDLSARVEHERGRDTGDSSKVTLI